MSQSELDEQGGFIDPDGIFVVEGLSVSEGLLVNEAGMTVPSVTLATEGYFNTQEDVEDDIGLRIALLWPQNIRMLAQVLLQAADRLEEGMELPEDPIDLEGTS